MFVQQKSFNIKLVKDINECRIDDFYYRAETTSNFIPQNIKKSVKTKTSFTLKIVVLFKYISSSSTDRIKC